MRSQLSGTVWRLTAFLGVCSLGLFALLATFAELRFQDANVYRAEFSNITGLQSGNFVRVAGVEVGKVKNISIKRDATVVVGFATDTSVVLTEGSRAAIRYQDLIGGRYLSLEEGVGGMKRLAPGEVIPVSRTAPALDLDAVIGGFKPLFRALDPEQVNALSAQLIHAFQGEGPTINSLLAQTATFTSALADRDQLIGQTIANLNTVLGTIGDESDQFDKGVDSLSQLVAGLAERKSDIATGLAYTNAAAVTVADLLQQARPAIQRTVHEADRVGELTLADHDYLDNLINTLPDKYKVLSRLGLYGDYFSFYICDLILKLNGKGGQPVYVKLAGQSSGRCAPK
ncbi:MCE family protein [Mycobacterium hubeiense]|uniref:MCE family protein n=1 Tax=Mycobacterium hubeiense TaxID=1867256 RepID=UPI000C7F697A|nr:MCE family protein [Mycobacterium sp. QGD 101]